MHAWWGVLLRDGHALCMDPTELKAEAGSKSLTLGARLAAAMAVTLVLVAAIIVAIWALARKARGPHEAPGPYRWPVLGNLPHLRARVPYQALTALGKQFGPVYSLQLGSVPAVVVSGLDNIKQVLYHKFNHFDSRPNFNRYHQIFDGDKENSLAFCDWSEVQRKRRELLNDHTFPKVYSNNFKDLSSIISEEVKELVQDLAANTEVETLPKRKALFNNDAFLSKRMKRLLGNKHISTFVRLPSIEEVAEEEMPVEHAAPVDIKQKLLQTTASIFLRYFCSLKTDKDQDLKTFLKNFDKIFYEVNQGYASDFLPFLENIVGNNMAEMKACSAGIRQFVQEKIIRDRLETFDGQQEDRDYVDSLLRNVKFGGDVQISEDAALFSLEDILGGHSAIGNFIVKLLTFVVDNEEVQSRILKEVEVLDHDFVSLDDRAQMPYTESVIMEALRLISSPIVPHVANQDTQISGYHVKKGTLIFLNNYDLNMSENLWTEPEKFDPSRFLDPVTGTRTKPVHFLPFGGGRRSCMGYKLVQFISFVVVANLVRNFRVKGVTNEDYKNVPIGNLALPEDTFKFAFQSR